MKILTEADVNNDEPLAVFSIVLQHDGNNIDVKCSGIPSELANMIAHAIAGNRDAQQVILLGLQIFCKANNIPLSSVENIIAGNIHIVPNA